MICLTTLQIFSVRCRKGRIHDFRILKESNISIHPDIKKLGDSGYQGIDAIYSNTQIPFKATKNKKLTKQEKQFNKNLSCKRIFIEHVNRRCKIFRITKEVYRGKHKKYGRTWNIVAGLVNLRYAA